jgi:hypothetical protein
MTRVNRWHLLGLYLVIVVAPMIIMPFGVMLYQAYVCIVVLALFLYALLDIGDVSTRK